jgi:hypothetical protein
MTDQTTTSWDAWLERDRHTITLPSGAVVTIRLLELPDHFVFGDTPDELRRAAMGDLGKKLATEDVTDEERAQVFATLAEYFARVVVDSLIEPAPPEGVSAIDVARMLPERDRDMLLQIQQRSLNVDAAGKELPFPAPGDVGEVRDERDGETSSTPDAAVGTPVPANRAARRRARAVPDRGSSHAAG